MAASDKHMLDKQTNEQQNIPKFPHSYPGKPQILALQPVESTPARKRPWASARRAHHGPVISANAQATQIRFLARQVFNKRDLTEHANRLYQQLKCEVDDEVAKLSSVKTAATTAASPPAEGAK